MCCLIVQLFEAVAFHFESSDFNLSPERDFLEAFYLYYYYYYYCYRVPPFNLALGTRMFFTICQPRRAAGVVHMAALKNPHVQCPKKLDVVVVVVAVEPQSQSCPPSPACDIIQARCNDVDNETMDSSTHTPTAPIRLEDKRRFTLSQNIELSP